MISASVSNSGLLGPRRNLEPLSQPLSLQETRSNSQQASERGKKPSHVNLVSTMLPHIEPQSG